MSACSNIPFDIPLPKAYSGLLMDINHIIVFIRFRFKNLLSEHTLSTCLISLSYFHYLHPFGLATTLLLK